MFAVLDTNHFVALCTGGPQSERIKQRVLAMDADLFTSIVTAQEVAQGWLAALNREKSGTPQIYAYSRFQRSLSDLARVSILPFDADAAAHFHRLQASAPRVGTMDLKIAAICISHAALLLTRNLVDFEKIPGLRVENWVD